MAIQNETPPLGAAGLGDNSFPDRNSSEINTKSLAVQAATVQASIPGPAVQARINDLNREFIVECLRIAALKASHGADNVEIGDDLNGERDIRLAIQNLREGSRAFRELELRLAEGRI
jgi:hypothetical protein